MNHRFVRKLGFTWCCVVLCCAIWPSSVAFADPPDNRGDEVAAQGGGSNTGLLPSGAPDPSDSTSAASVPSTWGGVQPLAPLGAPPYAGVVAAPAAQAGNADSSIAWLGRKMNVGNWVLDAAMSGAAGVLKFVVGTLNGLLASLNIPAVGNFVPDNCSSPTGSILFCTPLDITVNHPAMARIWPITKALGAALLTFLVIIRISRMVVEGQYSLAQEGKSAIMAFFGASLFIAQTDFVLTALVNLLNALNDAILSSALSFNLTDPQDLNVGLLLMQLMFAIMLLLLFFRAVARIAQLLVLFSVAPIAGALLMDRSTAGRFSSWLGRVIEVLLEQSGWVILFTVAQAIITPLQGQGNVSNEVAQMADFFFASLVVGMCLSGGSALAILGGGGGGGMSIGRMVGTVAGVYLGARGLAQNVGRAAATGGRVATAPVSWTANAFRNRGQDDGLATVPNGRGPRGGGGGGAAGSERRPNGNGNADGMNGSTATNAQLGYPNTMPVERQRDARVDRSNNGRVTRRPIIVGSPNNRPQRDQSVYKQTTQPLSPAMLPQSVRSVSGDPNASAGAQRQMPADGTEYISLAEWNETPALWATQRTGKKAGSGVRKPSRTFKANSPAGEQDQESAAPEVVRQTVPRPTQVAQPNPVARPVTVPVDRSDDDLEYEPPPGAGTSGSSVVRPSATQNSSVAPSTGSGYAVPTSTTRSAGAEAPAASSGSGVGNSPTQVSTGGRDQWFARTQSLSTDDEGSLRRIEARLTQSKSELRKAQEQHEQESQNGTLVGGGEKIRRYQDLTERTERAIEQLERDKALLLGGRTAMNGIARQQQLDRASRYERIADSLQDAGLSDLSDHWRTTAAKMRSEAK